MYIYIYLQLRAHISHDQDKKKKKIKNKAKPVLFCPYALKGQIEALQYWAGAQQDFGRSAGSSA